ncbi:type II secretion system F family protein [Neobacillus dielmonensis]|uniref:type II secretion system F family protein n=1 Tax=Neobacillus dielmonensis TaxID=1347369 RepID=UPI00069400DF|nr:type II secretion system F family protein [Neobacillus dielmonensis]
MNLFVQLLEIVVAVTLVTYIFLKRVTDKQRMTSRLREFLPTAMAKEGEEPHEKAPSVFRNGIQTVSRVFRNIQFSVKTKKNLLEAGSPLKPEEFFALRLFAAAGAGMIINLLGAAWYLSLLAAVTGFILPNIVMGQKRKKRLARINYQLIEVLGMTANSMRAGFSFLQAMQLVGREVPDPLGPEFDRVVRQISLGIPLEEVFEEMMDRLPNKELEVVVRAILAQRKSGGNLAELLETMEETIRGRVRIVEELHTLTAQGRLSSWVITLIPIGLGIYLALVNKDYFSPMLEHPLGWLMLFVATISTIIGWMFIQKIIRIEV